MKQCYNVTVRCGNCKEYVGILIPQGTEIKEALEDKTCPNCGCSVEIRKDNGKYEVVDEGCNGCDLFTDD